MSPLFDRLGTPVAFYIEAESRLLTAWGSDSAWISLGSVYAFSGAHVGWWRGDHMRGHDGGIVVWALGAVGLGLALPRPFEGFTPPRPGPAPIRAFTQLPPPEGLDFAAWSTTMFNVW